MCARAITTRAVHIEYFVSVFLYYYRETLLIGCEIDIQIDSHSTLRPSTSQIFGWTMIVARHILHALMVSHPNKP